MAVFRDAINLQRRSLGELERARNESSAWADEQRLRLDRKCLDPLQADGRRLVDVLSKAARDLLDAERMLAQ